MSRSRFAEYRDKVRGGPPRKPKPHGTAAAVRRHERAGEELCEACRLERNRIAREKYERAKARKG